MLNMHLEMHVDLHEKYLLLWSDLNQDWNVWTNFSKTLKLPISMKIHSAVLKLLPTDRWQADVHLCTHNILIVLQLSTKRDWHTDQETG
jgi:hypothetical protein